MSFNTLEGIFMQLILFIGWPILFITTFFIVKRGNSFANKLKKTAAGKLMAPTIAGWMFGLYATGIVSTAYMLNIQWYYVVIPVFIVFLIAVLVIYEAINNWEKEATEIHKFYEKLEKLVDERTAKLKEAHKLSIKHEKEIQKLKDQFVFIAAHELKTPVTSIKWSIDTALEEKKDLKPELKDLLVNVQSSNQRLISLVDDLLNVARIESGTVKISFKKIDLNNIINQTIKEMHSVFLSKKIKVNYSSHKNIVWADSERIKQILINLLSNATKYNKDKGEINIKILDGKNHTSIAIEDTGIGIEEKSMDILFTKFGRIRTKKNRAVDGTGLGLYLSKKLVEAMGGEISATSVPSKGTRFVFSLPKSKKAT